MSRNHRLLQASAWCAAAAALQLGVAACGKKSDAKHASAAPATPAVDAARNAGDSFAAAQMSGSADVGVVRAARDVVRIGDKFYTSAVLTNAFGSDPSVQALIKSLVQSNTGSFGGPCDQLGKVGTNDCGSQTSNSQAPVIPQSLATREGYRTRACEAITQLDVAVNFAATSAVKAANAANPSSTMLTADAAPTNEGIGAAYALFHPGHVPAASVVDGLAAVAADPSNTKAVDAWRYVLLSLCLSPDWQLL